MYFKAKNTPYKLIAMVIFLGSWLIVIKLEWLRVTESNNL
jgi:hypothetical protein